MAQSNFFPSRPNLMPQIYAYSDPRYEGMLTKIKGDETNRSLRYKSYAESLALECEKWYIDNGCLPDMKVWKAKSYKYNVDDERRKRIQALVSDIYQGMKQIIG